jgi:hypothetical protein
MKYPKRSFKKKTYKKTKKMRLKTGVDMGLGFPKSLMVKQKYTDTIILSSPGGAIASHQFILNSLYDPNFTAVGHQPMYFDQYMAVYNHYTVVGCRITATFVPYESNGVPVIVALWQNDDLTITPAGMEFQAEQSKSKTYLLGDGGNASKTLSLNWSARKTFGPNIMSNSLLRGDATTSPSETTVAVLSLQSADRVTATNTAVQINMEFISIYNELKDISGS